MYPRRALVKGVSLQFYCSKAEAVYIKQCAKKGGQSLSAYLRAGAIKGFKSRDKSLPTEVLAFRGQLAQLDGQLEIIARKRLDGEELNGCVGVLS
ncbi:MAG TPA: hypothetical protein VG605_05405 [Puia sp.]|nr:hypothetical protein [Puia sp.]